MNLTLEEQERMAYQSGNVREVELLGEALGAASEDEIAELEREAYERGKTDGIEEKRDAMLQALTNILDPLEGISDEDYKAIVAALEDA